MTRRDGQVRYALIQTTEKLPHGARLVAHGTSGHGSRPLRTNAIVHLSRAVEKIAHVGSAHALQRHHALLLRETGRRQQSGGSGALQRICSIRRKSAAAREYLAEHEPGHYSMLHTSISPNIITGGFQINVIPSEAEATLDIRALPDEDMPKFFELMRKVINDPAVRLCRNRATTPPGRAAVADRHRSLQGH